MRSEDSPENQNRQKEQGEKMMKLTSVSLSKW